jgi:hypothetical protein
MEKQVEVLEGAPLVPEPSAPRAAEPSGAPPTELKRTNAGWFRLADPRINREGRPRGSRKAAGAPAEDRAAQADRLALLRFPARQLVTILEYRLGYPWPDGTEIVSARSDNATGELLLVLRSPAFARVAAGAVIPQVASPGGVPKGGEGNADPNRRA